MIASPFVCPARGRFASLWSPWLGLAVVAGVGGCGDGSRAAIGKVYEVKGKVLLADGKPLGGGHVYFVRNDGTLSSEGKIGPDGTFSLATGSAGEGTPPGEYKVRVVPEDPSLIQAKRKPGGKTLPYAQKYLDEDSSGLTVTVKAEPNQLEPFRLK